TTSSLHFENFPDNVRTQGDSGAARDLLGQAAFAAAIYAAFLRDAGRAYARGFRDHGSSTSNWSPRPSMVAVGTRIAPRPPHRSRRARLTPRAPPLGQTSASKRWGPARNSAHSRQSDQRGNSAQSPNHGRLSAVPLG